MDAHQRRRDLLGLADDDGQMLEPGAFAAEGDDPRVGCIFQRHVGRGHLAQPGGGGGRIGQHVGGGQHEQVPAFQVRFQPRPQHGDEHGRQQQRELAKRQRCAGHRRQRHGSPSRSGGTGVRLGSARPAASPAPAGFRAPAPPPRQHPARPDGAAPRPPASAPAAGSAVRLASVASSPRYHACRRLGREHRHQLRRPSAPPECPAADRTPPDARDAAVRRPRWKPDPARLRRAERRAALALQSVHGTETTRITGN